MLVANKDLIKEINQFNILNTIRKEGQISRVELVKKTGLSKASVTGITARLIEGQWVYEKEMEDSKNRGRRRIFLAMNPESAFVVGVKISIFHISCAVTDILANIQHSLTLPIHTQESTFEQIVDLIEKGIRLCIAKSAIQVNQVKGIGIGIPGLVDKQNGICYWTPLYEQGRVSILKMIHDKFDIPTFIENDANTVTLAEQWFGEGRGADNFLVVTIEHGIGMGIVINGQIYRGVNGIGAECGHTIIIPDGELCRCGKRGCLEAYTGEYAILEFAKQAHANGEWKCKDIEGLTIESLIKLAILGEAVLLNIFERAGVILGIGLSNLIYTFNPSKIIITGEGVRAGNLMFKSMRQEILNQTRNSILSSTEILIQSWNDEDWARGAASLALEEIYKSPLNRLIPVI